MAVLFRIPMYESLFTYLLKLRIDRLFKFYNFSEYEEFSHCSSNWWTFSCELLENTLMEQIQQISCVMGLLRRVVPAPISIVSLNLSSLAKLDRRSRTTVGNPTDDRHTWCWLPIISYVCLTKLIESVSRWPIGSHKHNWVAEPRATAAGQAGQVI